jgi:hypothetical protein
MILFFFIYYIIKMSEINIKVKSITDKPVDLKIVVPRNGHLPQFDLKIVNPRTVYLLDLYAKVYWNIMGTKNPSVEYEDTISDTLVTLNAKLKSDNHKNWEAKSDDDGKVVYVYKPRNSEYDSGDTNISVSNWKSKFPPTEFAPGQLDEARSYFYPTDMKNFKDLVLITSKPLTEKRIDHSDQLPYTEDEFINHYGERQGADKWRGAIYRPIHQEIEVAESPRYVIIPGVWNVYKNAVGYLEEGSDVYYFFKMINPPPQPPIRGGKRKSKRKKSKKRKSKRRKSKSKSKRRRRRSR